MLRKSNHQNNIGLLSAIKLLFLWNALTAIKLD